MRTAAELTRALYEAYQARDWPAAHALLQKNPNPTEPEIRLWLAGNLCRCTGYDKIIRAIQAAAAETGKGSTV